jgi:hypothetical protein
VVFSGIPAVIAPIIARASLCIRSTWLVEDHSLSWPLPRSFGHGYGAELDRQRCISRLPGEKKPATDVRLAADLSRRVRIAGFGRIAHDKPSRLALRR